MKNLKNALQKLVASIKSLSLKAYAVPVHQKQPRREVL